MFISHRFVDELLTLVDINIYNSYTGAPLRVKLALLYYVCDFPANSKVFLTAGAAAYRACPFCVSTGIYPDGLNKVVHVCSRDFLDSESPLRKDADKFLSILPKPSDAPPLPEDPESELELRKKYDKLPNQNQKKKHLKETGHAGEYAFLRAPGHDRTSQTVPDGMHTLADAIQSMFDIILGKMKETFKKFEVKVGRASSCDPSSHRNKRARTEDSTAPWELSAAGLETADEIARSIRYPPSSSLSNFAYFSNPSKLSKNGDAP